MAMPADVQIATFVAAFRATLEYGMERGQAVWTNRVRAFRTELEELQRMVKVYLRRHFSLLMAHSAKVRELLVTAMNSGMKDGMTALATQGGVLHRKHQFRSPRRRHRLSHDHDELHAPEEARRGRRRNQPRGTHGVLEAGVRKDSRTEQGEEEGSPRRGRAANSPPARP